MVSGILMLTGLNFEIYSRNKTLFRQPVGIELVDTNSW